MSFSACCHYLQIFNMGLIPDRWLKYSAVGAQIEGTRFIAFKVPLDNLDINATKDAQGIDVDVNEMINTKIMVERIPNLGLVIDLTNTKKYYNSKNVTDFGIEYKKIFVPGQKLPAPHIYKEFMSTVTDFLRRNAENGKLIGVHCTHGLNRTGLMICAHMIQQLNFEPSDAVARFEAARGHKMERENYVASLQSMTAKLQLTDENSTSEFICHGNQRTISTQTNHGIWLETGKRKAKRKRWNDVTDVNDIKGTVLVDGSSLISDGNGGYYMRVDLNDVRPLRKTPHTQSAVDTQSNQRNYPPPNKYHSNSGQDRSRPHHANRSASHHSNYQPNPSNYQPNPTGVFFANNTRYASNNRPGRRTDDIDDRRLGPPFYQPNNFNDSKDLFKY